MRTFATIVATILAVMALFILVFVLVGMLLSNTYRVTRSIEINATPAVIHRYVGDLSQWPHWDPWSEADATIRTTVEKPTGVGANQHWTSANGDGRLEFTRTDPTSGVHMDLFFEGDSLQCTSAFTYIPQGPDRTQVTWTMEGTIPTPVIGGYCAMLMDTMAGPMFERGLQKLKAAVESGAAPAPNAVPATEPAPETAPAN